MSNVCNLCHSRPVMDRCSCCEQCWYDGSYTLEREREEDARFAEDVERGAFDDDGYWRPLL